MPRCKRVVQRAVAVLLLVAPVGLAQVGTNSAVTVNSSGQMAVLGGWTPSVSPDGRFIAFDTHSPDVVPNDLNFWGDVFLHDRVTGQTVLVSESLSGIGGNSQSGQSSVSQGGLYVAFTSGATDLAVDVSVFGVFVRDMLAGVTELVSTDSAGLPGNGGAAEPSISADGQMVAFASESTNLVREDSNGASDIFVHDRSTGETIRVSVASDGSQANGFSTDPSISLDGQHVVFESVASNLVPDDTNGVQDVFVHDLVTGQTERVDVKSGGLQDQGAAALPAISGDGQVVAFKSYSNELVPGDDNDMSDIFVHDRQTGLTTCVSVSSSGVLGNGWSGQTFPGADERWLSADGRFVTFESGADNLVSNDFNVRTDIFLHDRLTGLTSIVSLDVDGALADGNSDAPSMSADGRYIAFESIANDLVPDDTTPSFSQPDTFVRDRGAWTNLGSALAGSLGLPDLFAQGSLESGDPGSLLLRRAKPGAPAALLVAVPGTPVPFKGGLLWAVPPLLQVPVLPGPSGSVLLTFLWPAGIPPATVIRMQFLILDAAAVSGVALSNGVEALVP